MMKFLSLKDGQKYGWTDMQVEIVKYGPLLCKLRKSCGPLEPKMSKLGLF